MRWFLRDAGLELRDESKFGSRVDVGVNVKG